MPAAPRGGLPITTAPRPEAASHPHSLAPAHLGDVQAGAALAVAILGVAIFIAAIGMVVTGLTVGAGFDPANLPPNVDELGTTQVLIGFGLFGLGTILAGGALLLLSGASRPRIPIAVLSVVSGVAAGVAGAYVIARGPSDLVLAISLFGLGLGLIGAGLLLLRPRR
jgi:hypothetical protein